MSTTNLKPRKQLNESQLEILEALYKFRFATVDLIVKYQGLDSSKYTYARLKKLEENKYIGRKYDGSYRIHGKPAIYFLLPEGMRILRVDPDISTRALNGMYKDGTVEKDFMEHCLNIFSFYTRLNDTYGNKLSFNTRNEIIESKLFPRPLPDAYITIKNKQGTEQYMLELIDPTKPFYTIRKVISHYIKHFNYGDWDETGTDYPVLLLVCDNRILEQSIQRLTVKTLNRAETDDLKVYTTTVKAILALDMAQKAIWSDVLNPENFSAL